MDLTANRLKNSRSGELKSSIKKDPKYLSSNRTIDTKDLIKLDHIKSLSRLALNYSSRDVSHIRDKFLAPIPQLVPSLPTDFEHLKQLYYSSDTFGMPFSVSSSNLISPLTCRKQSCVQNSLVTHHFPPVPEDSLPDSIERLDLGKPSGRRDIQLLQKWLSYMKETILPNFKSETSTWSVDDIEKAEVIYVMAGKEVIRQVSVHCLERGEVLKEILWFFIRLYRQLSNVYNSEYKDKLEDLALQLDEVSYRNARQIAQYEIAISKKNEQIEALNKEITKITEELRAANLRIMEIQEEFQGKAPGGIFNKHISGFLHKSMTKSKISERVILESAISSSLPNKPIDIPEIPKTSFTLSNTNTLVEIQAPVPNDLVLESKINEKETQTGSLEAIEAEAQTEDDPKQIKSTKLKLDFRPRLSHDSKSKATFNIEILDSFNIASSLQLAQPNPNLLQSPVVSIPTLKSIKPRSGSLMVAHSNLLSDRPLLSPSLNQTNLPAKRHSFVHPDFESLSKSSSGVSPLLAQINEDPYIAEQLYSFASSPLPPPDDLLLQNILIKQNAYKELSATIKSKKAELKTLSSEIEEKQQNLSVMRREIQLKYLELQAVKMPTGKTANDFKRIVMEKLEGIREEKAVRSNKVLLEVNDLSIEIDASLEQLIPVNLDIISWKAGFNAGFEKGLALGLSEGEELGIEVGEEKGYLKTIKELKEGLEEDDESESSSDDDGRFREMKGERNVVESIKEYKEKKIESKGKFIENKERVLENKTKAIENKAKIVEKKGKIENKPKIIENKGKISDTKEKIIENKTRIKVNKASALQKTENRVEVEEEASDDQIEDGNELVEKDINRRYTAEYINQDESFRNSTQPVSRSKKMSLVSKRVERSTKRQEPLEKKIRAEEFKMIENKHKAHDESRNSQLKNRADEHSEKPKHPKDREKTLKSYRSEEQLKNPNARDQQSLPRARKITDRPKDSIKIKINADPESVLDQIHATNSVPDQNTLNLLNSVSPSNKPSHKLNSSNEDLGKDDLADAIADSELSEPEKLLRRKEPPGFRKRIKEYTKFNEFKFNHQRAHLTLPKKSHQAGKLIEEFLKKKTRHIIRRSKMSKRMAFRILNSIYQSYQNKLKTSEPPSDLIEHTYEEFLQKYSMKAVCEKKLLELVSTLIKFSDCRRALMFLKLTSLSEKLDIQGYSLNSVAFYVTAMNLLASSKLGIVIAVDETADRIMIPLVRALECARELFDGKIDRNQLSKLVNKLEAASVKDPKKINTNGLIESEHSLELMLEFYEIYQKSIVEGLNLLIHSFKYKEDLSIIYRNEFQVLVKNISPGKYKDEEFEENAVISYEELTQKCIEKNVLSIEDVQAFVLKEQNAIGEKEIFSDKPEIMKALRKIDKKFKGIDAKVWADKVEKLYEGYSSRDMLESFISWRILSNEVSSL